MRPVRRVHPQQLGSSACSRTSPDDRASIPLLGQQHLAAEDSQRDPRAVAAATNTETEPRPMDRNSNRGTSVVAGRIAVGTEARRNVAVTGMPVRHGNVGETVHRHVAMPSLHRNRNPTDPREPVATETVEFPSPNGTVVRIDENGGNSWRGIHMPTYVAVSGLRVPQSNGNLQHDHRHSNSHHSKSHVSAPCLLDRVSDNRQPAGEIPDAGLPSTVSRCIPCAKTESLNTPDSPGPIIPASTTTCRSWRKEKPRAEREFRPGASRLTCRKHESERGQTDDKSSRPPD